MSGPVAVGTGRVFSGGGGVNPDLGRTHPDLCVTLALQGCEGTGHHEGGKWHRCLCSLQEKEGKCGCCEYKGDRWGRRPPQVLPGNQTGPCHMFIDRGSMGMHLTEMVPTT